MLHVRRFLNVLAVLETLQPPNAFGERFWGALLGNAFGECFWGTLLGNDFGEWFWGMILGNGFGERF